MMGRPDPAEVLSGLKDFQRKTAEYVFDRFYGLEPTRRFLVADEVGLGKTLVARGVIAQAIDFLWDTFIASTAVFISLLTAMRSLMKFLMVFFASQLTLS